MIQKQNHLFSSFFLVFLYSLTRFITFCSSVNPNFEACHSETCGNQTITYPFYIQGRHEAFCGYPGFGLSCPVNGFPILNISHIQYVIHEISYETRSIRVSEAAISSSNTTSSLSSCAIPRTHNITLDGTRFNYAPKQRDLFLLFGCNLELLPRDFLKYRIGCSSAENETISVLGMTEGEDFRFASEKCNGGMVKTKIDSSSITIINEDLVRKGFVLNWIVSDCSLCEKSGGKCGFNTDREVYNFKCYCPDRDHAQKCDPPEDKGRALKLGLGIGLGIGLPAILMIAWLIGRRCYNRKHGSDDDQYFEPRNSYSADDYSNSDPENGNIYLGVPLFSYKQLQEATNNFDQARVLGDGGFGIVYYGKLRDGREVAVKRLYEHNYRRVEQFRNEVKILTRLRHKNLVSLYGCTPRRSQELLVVYEYISNGTVASHLQGNNNSNSSTSMSLPWPIRIKIAIETASALVYLHASDIIHRDVKTTNILVDNNFNVKVADFGLSRLFPNDVSHVSTAPQGTPGYVDPEYYQCYQLTSKSDVYSFGVVLIELISSKPAVDISRNKDEVNLSSLAMKKIQGSAFMELVDPFLGIEKDGEVKRMVVSVGELAFQCLQKDKDLRPSMAEVLEALKRIQSGKGDGEVENLEGGGDNVNPSAQPPPPPPSPPLMSPEKEEVGMLKKTNPPPSSPNTVTDKWMSESSTPDASA